MTFKTVAGDVVVDDISQRDPDLVSTAGSRTWSVRGRNFVVAITELAAGDSLIERDVPEEYLLVVQDGAVVSVEHDGQAVEAGPEAALVVVPAGTSAVRAAAATTVARAFTARCDEQMRRAVNYAAGADLRATPLPERTEVASHEMRVHHLHGLTEEEGRLGRIFRTTSLMVNWFPAHEGPRDTERLSPHAHEDFEQLSMTLVGNYVHHLRVPWTTRMSEWRDDEHAQVSSPSMTLIPPTVVHTTRAVRAGPHTLIDVFAPPREDFLAKGWVLNAAEYQRAQP